MTVKMGRIGQDTGLVYSDGSPVRIGDIAEFDPVSWYDGNVPKDAMRHIFKVGYENGRVTGLGTLDEAATKWHRVIEFDEVLGVGGCEITFFDRELKQLSTGRAHIVPPGRLINDLKWFKYLNPDVGFDPAARWLVISDFRENSAVLLDLS